jgi:hypothetical protein
VDFLLKPIINDYMFGLEFMPTSSGAITQFRVLPRKVAEYELLKAEIDEV